VFEIIEEIAMGSAALRLGALIVFVALLISMMYAIVQYRSGAPSEVLPDQTASPDQTALPDRIVLYDQYDNAIWWGPPGDSQGQAADDFVVPSGQIWAVDRVEVAGIYFDTYFDNSEHGAQSVNVEIYDDAGSLPGAPISAQRNLTFTLLPSDSAEAQVVATPATPDTNFDRTRGSFVIPIDQITMEPGAYWLSVRANMPESDQLGHLPRWVWVARQVTANHLAAFRSDRGLGSCTSWGYIASCSINPDGDYDLVFRLRGNILSGPAAETPGYSVPGTTPADSPTPAEPTSTATK
jgi:hypothetical protein